MTKAIVEAITMGKQMRQKTAGQRIRGPNLEVLASRAKGVQFEEAIAMADSENRVIVSNKRMTQALIHTKEWKGIKEAFACWTGTMVGYIEPDKSFREGTEKISSLANRHFIFHRDSESGSAVLFPVPYQFLDVKNAVIISEHPDYVLEENGKVIIVIPSSVHLAEEFPSRNGYYLVDEEWNLPKGRASDHRNTSSMYLWRIDKYVGPIARGYLYQDFGNKRGVGLDCSLSNNFGLVVEAP